MGKWGPDQDDTFVVAAGSLTDTFEDNMRVANTPTIIQAFIYIDYTQGNETKLEMRVEESPQEDEGVTVEDYFVETIADNEGCVTPYIFCFETSGRYRIPFQIGESEDRLRVAVRGAGTPAFTGSVTLLYGVR